MKRAVVIGVDEYRDDHISPLPGARNDATEMYSILKKSGDFEMEQPLLGRAATADAVRAAVSDLLWRMDPLELALFYFSGHAFDDEYGNGFLAPYDLEWERPLVHGLRVQELNDLVRKAKNKNVILLVLDACKAGMAAEDARGGAEAKDFSESFDLDEDEGEEEEVEESGIARGRIVLASSGPDENSRELPGCVHQFSDDPETRGEHVHGAFTYHLLEGLSGRAAREGEDVTIGDLHAFVEKALKTQTVTFRGSGIQHSGNIRLVRATGFQTIVKQLELAETQVGVGDARSLFTAIAVLRKIREHTTTNPRAREIRDRIDERLGPAGDGDRVRSFFSARSWDLLAECQKSHNEVDNLLSDLSFETIASADGDLVSIVLNLWVASDADADSPEYKRWLDAMKAREKTLSAPAPVTGKKKGAEKAAGKAT